MKTSTPNSRKTGKFMSEKKAEFAEIRQVYEVQRCLGNLKLNSVKNKTNIILVNCTRPVGQVVLEMHSSESKTYSSQTSGRVKVFCPVGDPKRF